MLYEISIWVVPVLLAITLHEAAHAWMAWRLGDDTAMRLGRVTMNPLKHIDPFGTVLLPGLLLLSGMPVFGYAKPVPVLAHRLQEPKSDMVWVAAAGPGMNILLAIASALLLNFFATAEAGVGLWITDVLLRMIYLNVFLAVLNMLPIPPLDGGRVVTGLLPGDLSRKYAQIEPYGFFIIIGLFMLPFLLQSLFGINFSILGMTLLPIVEYLYDVLDRAFIFVG
jgi:Zn-dependent protease